ncbi:MAG: hypothetical protein ABW148_18645 [Sedimenticola sp.]
MNTGNVAKSIAYGEWLNWLNKRFPGSKNKILNKVHNRLGQDETDPAWYEQVITAAATIVPTYYNYKMQSKLVDAQIARAQAGQAPLDQSYFNTASNIGPTVKHQFDTGMSENTKNMLVFGGLGLAAFYLLSNTSRA